MGRAVVVTGGSKGIGRGLVEGLRAAGYDIGVLDVLDAPGPPEPAGEDGYGRLVSARCDIADPEAVAAAFGELAGQLGTVQGLVNNAGIYPRARLTEMDHRRWLRVVEVNLGGAASCIRSLLAQLPSGMDASVVNVSSSIAYEGALQGSHYAASKAGVLGLTKALALELAPHVRVNAVAPGVTDTDQVREGGRGPAELAQFAATSVPLRRLCTPEDVLNLVEFLLSERAGYITGQAIHVNGGLYLH